jgi:hypothetical protein
MSCETGNNELDDIEDLVKPNEPSFQRIGQRDVVPKIKEPRKKPKEKAEGANIPGTQTIYIKTWGCAHNTSDGGKSIVIVCFDGILKIFPIFCVIGNSNLNEIDSFNFSIKNIWLDN